MVIPWKVYLKLFNGPVATNGLYESLPALCLKNARVGYNESPIAVVLFVIPRFYIEHSRAVLFVGSLDMAGFSYDTHEDDSCEDDFLLCCGLFYVTGLLAAVVFICAAAFSFLGIATNAIQQHHIDSRPLRDLYLQYDLDPDDEITQTIAAWSVLVILLVILAISVFSWWVIYNTYRIYASRDRTNRSGYCQGLPTTERL
ncbi:unnamed protein product [Strongylus vulgaris]|uniref:Uncharacterized protein n=1 Tax=Strongylus vulgaris TaxID=40348 RepID=A0A3P7L4E4_STRVU|nr:unnamed protein product [Strongylus vulgaris]